MFFKFLFVFICLFKLYSTQNIVWNGNWAMMCDFIGNDFANANVPGEQCSNQCQRTSGCTHYSWTNYNGGTCWMKKGTVTKNDAVPTNDPTMVCGLLDGGSTGGGSNIENLKGQFLWSDEFDSYTTFENNWIQETGGLYKKTKQLTYINSDDKKIILYYKGWGWGNNELQYYTNNNENTEINGGLLTIHTRKQNKGSNRFTSARLISKRTFKYGVFEMKAKIPYGRGTWPAFWLLAANRPLSWPTDGEIDIMEHVGYDMNTVHATIHCKAYNHVIGTQIGRSTKVDDVSNQYHLYQLYWTKDVIKGYVDNREYFSYSRPANSNYENWPFDNEFEILLNTAVGGDWGGVQGVDENIFPQRYTIDYVRVWQPRN